MIPQMIPHNSTLRAIRKSRIGASASPAAYNHGPAIDRGPAEINPIQWHQAIGYARTQCARIFRDGGGAADALKAFSLEVRVDKAADWSFAVQSIALHLCTPAR